MGSLTTEQMTWLETQVAKLSEQVLNARKIYGSDVMIGNNGAQVYKDYLLGQFKDASVDLNYVTHDNDAINLTPREWLTRVVQSSYIIPGRDLEALANQGINLTSTGIEECMRTVGVKEDQMLIKGISLDGGTTYAIPGLAEGAGTSDATSFDFTTPGQCIEAVKKAVGVLGGLKIPGPYDLILTPALAAELEGNIFSSIDEGLKVQKQLRGGRVWDNIGLDAGEGLVIASSGRGYYKYAVARDLQVKQYSKEEDVKIKVNTIGVPIIKNAYAIYRFTNL